MDCPVCHTKITNGEVTLKCSHKLCVPCFTQWARMANTCPCCRDTFAEPPQKEEKQTKKITGVIARGIITTHETELNDYSHIRVMELNKKRTDAEKLALINDIINYNINIMASRMVNWYEDN